MKADFPSSPAVGDIYTANSVIWTWTGKQWTKATTNVVTKSYVDIADSLKASIASPTFTGTVTLPSTTITSNLQAATKAYVDTSVSNLVNSAPATLNTLNELAAALGDDASFSTNVTALIAAKAPTESPTFTGTVTLPSTAITNNLQAVTKAYVDTQLSSATSGGTTKTYVDTQDALKANIASPTFTGTVAGITAAMVGLGNVTNTSDANKPVSTAQQTALDAKAPIASPTFTGTVTAPAFNSTSSIRFKENIAPIDDALSIVNKLQGVTFDWKESGQSDIGVIAEQVNEVIPQFVSKDETGDPQAVEYGKFTSILIEAVKQLAKRVEELENK